MRLALYARVSTRDKDQNPETQLRRLRELPTADSGWICRGAVEVGLVRVDGEHTTPGRGDGEARH